MATASPRATTAATIGRRFTVAIVTVGHEERPVRAGGRGVGKSVDGGPDRIRTGDLQRDRLACWAATPRVQLWRWRSIAEAPCLVAGRPRSPLAYTRRSCPSSIFVATPSPSHPPRCAGRWPR